MNKAQGRRHSALKTYYAQQPARTQKNKAKRVKKNEAIRESKVKNAGVTRLLAKDRLAGVTIAEKNLRKGRTS